MDYEKVYSENWYYTIEIDKGKYTNSMEHRNSAITRKLLRNVVVDNKCCLDIGTQEAVIPILLKKMGAKHVVAYDRYDFSEKINLLKDIYKVDLDYVGDVQLHDLPDALDSREGGRFFDLVVFSGVLYHMINPLGLLALVRGFCKVGGLFLIETVAVQHDNELLYFNAGGKKYGKFSNYFVPTSAWLDYVLRMLGLQPLEAIYLGNIENDPSVRLAILCRSKAAPCPLDDNDTWAHLRCHAEIFKDEAQFNWHNLSQHRTDINYSPYDENVVSIGNRTLYSSLAQIDGYSPSRDEWILSHDAKM